MDDDDGSAWAHQMELEQRQQEEEAIQRGRRILAESRRRQADFEREMTASTQRINANWSEFYGDHG